jgi:hypothetical protein
MRAASMRSMQPDQETGEPSSKVYRFNLASSRVG